MRVVIESPLKAATPEGICENLRYLLWCCRAVYLAGHEPIASHLICPWFMDDSDPKERGDGIEWSWMWLGDAHLFFVDLGESSGMGKAGSRCRYERIPCHVRRLMDYNPGCWAAFQRGEWPPHTAGFEVV